MGDVVGHKEYSSEGKIDPAGIDMDEMRSAVQELIDNETGASGGMNEDQDNALSAIYEQTGRWHPVRQVFQKTFYNITDGKFWTRAGLGDIWNEIVWDGYINPVDIIDGKDDPDLRPDSKNLARRGSAISYILGGYRESSMARRASEKNTALLEKNTALLEKNAASLEKLLVAVQGPPRS